VATALPRSHTRPFLDPALTFQDALCKGFRAYLIPVSYWKSIKTEVN
jgi:hypothetical protein